MLPGASVWAGEEFVGFVVANDEFFAAIPIHAAAYFGRKHSQKRHCGGAVAAFDVGDGR